MDTIAIQYILVGLLFLLAVGYLIRRFHKSTGRSAGDCGSGCGSCGIAKQNLRH